MVKILYIYCQEKIAKELEIINAMADAMSKPKDSVMKIEVIQVSAAFYDNSAMLEKENPAEYVIYSSAFFKKAGKDDGLLVTVLGADKVHFLPVINNFFDANKDFVCCFCEDVISGYVLHRKYHGVYGRKIYRQEEITYYITESPSIKQSELKAFCELSKKNAVFSVYAQDEKRPMRHIVALSQFEGISLELVFEKTLLPSIKHLPEIFGVLDRIKLRGKEKIQTYKFNADQKEYTEVSQNPIVTPIKTPKGSIVFQQKHLVYLLSFLSAIFYAVGLTAFLTLSPIYSLIFLSIFLLIAFISLFFLFKYIKFSSASDERNKRDAGNIIQRIKKLNWYFACFIAIVSIALLSIAIPSVFKHMTALSTIMFTGVGVFCLALLFYYFQYKSKVNAINKSSIDSVSFLEKAHDDDEEVMLFINQETNNNQQNSQLQNSHTYGNDPNTCRIF